MSENPKINASETPVAKSEELAPSELEKIYGGVASTPAKEPPKSAAFEIEDYSFDIEQVLNTK
jgi:hypothetical protein